MNFIAWHRISALLERHLLLQFRDLYRIVDNFYWPLMDILLFGFTSIWLTKQSGGDERNVLIMLGGLFLWNILMRTYMECGVNVLEEMWNQNLLNLFTVPFTLYDWVAALGVLGFLRCILITFTFACAFWIIFGIKITSFGLPLIIFIILQMLAGWAFGLFCVAALFYWGQKAQTLAWAGGWLLAPFSGALYPIEVLPPWMQKISAFLPTSYTFKAFRTYMQNGMLDIQSIAISFVGNLIVMAFTFALCVSIFNKAKEYGLERLQK